jgi:hypothetical protein
MLFAREFVRCACLVGAFMLMTTTSSATHAGVVVPVTMIDGLPVIPVKLGTVKVDFLLDTGGPAAITVPRPLIVPATGVVELADKARTIDASGQVQEIPRVRVASASIGDAPVGSLEGLVNYRWGLSLDGNEDPEVTKKGIIGIRALDKQRVVFDLGRSKLTFLDAAEEPALTGWATAPFVYDKRGVVVQFAANGKTADLVLDTAAAGNVLKKEAPVLVGPNNPCKGKPTTIPVCGVTTFRGASIGNAKLHRVQFAVVAMGELPYDGMLGIDFFLSHEVYLDFAEGTMHFRPLN